MNQNNLKWTTEFFFVDDIFSPQRYKLLSNVCPFVILFVILIRAIAPFLPHVCSVY